MVDRFLVTRPDTCEVPASPAAPTGNLTPLLHEIHHALDRWLAHGETHAIDLRAIPMRPEEVTRLLEILGQGEVQCELSLNGRTRVVETCFPAVWLTSHYDSDGRLAGRLIEICTLPAILEAQAADARAGLERLGGLLDSERLQ